MNPYDYERIGFLLEQLKLLGTKEWTPTEVCKYFNQTLNLRENKAPVCIFHVAEFSVAKSIEAVLTSVCTVPV